MSLCVSGRCSASCWIAVLSSSILGFNRSSNSSKSCRRCLLQGAKTSDSNWAHPALLHNPFLRRTPSFRAMACNWFLTLVRICTSRCRCQSSCRRSRFSGLGTQICRKRFFTSNCNKCFGVPAVRLLLPYSFGADLGRVANPQLEIQFRKQTLEPTCVPRRFHPYPHAAPTQAVIEALGFLLVSQFPLAAFSGFGIDKRDLLKTRVIITAYNQHTRLLPSEPLVGDTPKSIQFEGADTFMKSV